jgi:hypothetical protein
MFGLCKIVYATPPLELEAYAADDPRACIRLPAPFPRDFGGIPDLIVYTSRTYGVNSIRLSFFVGA